MKALRFYDRIGLLTPTRIDPSSGYRYYSMGQLPRLNRILALKDLGFTLEQIAPLLDDRVTAREIRGMLLLKEAEIEQQMAQEQTQLVHVRARLHQIEQEERMATYDVVIKPAHSQVFATARDTGRDLAHMPVLCEELCSEVHTLLAETEVKDTGPWLAFYHDTSGYRETDIDVEMAAPVAELPGHNHDRRFRRAQFRTEPAAETVASVIHHGEMARLGEAYAAIGSWIESNGYQISGPCREIYLRHPGPDIAPEDAVTEVQFPVLRK